MSTKNFICNPNYICQGVLNLILQYLDEKSKKNLKYSCHYLRDKIKLTVLKLANHKTSLLYPELKFLDLCSFKPKLNIPSSGALKITETTCLDFYDYNKEDIQILCVNYAPAYDSFIYYSKYLKELYILDCDQDFNLFSQTSAGDNLEIIYSPESYFKHFYVGKLKIIRSSCFQAISNKVNYTVVTNSVILNCSYMEILIILSKIGNQGNILFLKKTIINHLYIQEPKQFDCKEIYKSEIKNLYFVECSDFFKQKIIKNLKPLNYSDVKISDLPRFENCFDVNMYE